MSHSIPAGMKMTAIGLITLCAVTWPLAGFGVAAAPNNQTDKNLGWKYEYDNADRVTKITDPASRDTRLQYSFDSTQRLRKIVRSQDEGPTVTREFDDSGRLARMADGSGTVSYGYDDRGRLNHVQRQDSPAISYAYDTLDRVTRLQVGDFYRVDYSYDFLGRLELMKTPAGEIRYEYLTGQGKMVRTLPNGVKSIWEYTPSGELHQITHVDGHNAILAEYTYQYRSDGLIEAIQERSSAGQFVKRYEYDLMGRLTKASGPPGQQYSYEYDQLGNRVKAASAGKPPQSYTYDWVGRIMAVDGKPTRYDANGNLAEVTFSGATRQYRYHPDGRLAEARAGGETVQYRYDGMGHLGVRKTAAGETHFIPDPLSPYWQPLVIEERGGKRTLVVWDGATLLALLRDGKVEWLLHDHLGSVRLVTGGKGDVIRYREFDPFGVPVDEGQPAAVFDGFAGLMRDVEAAGYQTLTRMYVPQLGRFLQPDPRKRVPMETAVDFSLYNYCDGDPQNWVDRGGARKEPVGQQTAAISGSIYDLEVTNSQRISASDMKEIMRQPSYAKRIDAYLDKWIEIHGPGPVAIMMRGINDRYDGEDYAEKFFPDKRVIVLWSYEGPFKLLDVIRTIVDRYSPFRNLDLPKVFDRMSEKNSPVKYFIPESGGVMNTQKNADGLIKAAQSGKTMPTIIVSSADAGRSDKIAAMKKVGITVVNDDRVVDPQDAVKDLTKSWKDYSNPVHISGLHGSIQMGQSIINKIASGMLIPVGKTFPGHGIKGLEKHAAHQPEINEMLVGIPKRNPRLSPPEQTTAPVSRIGTEAPGIDPQRLQQARDLADVIMKQIGVAQGVIKKREISGGVWRVAGPGGMASPEAYAALREFRQMSLISPSPVGGVYLGGAGQSLPGIGQLDGVALDRNSNLVLLAKGGEEIKLPPLHMDDVVTVFRSVYLHGEGPSVSIDPNPENPEGSAMIIRHGKATENTYVGWVLYQADRLMKGYTLGVDNATAQQISTTVAGYPPVVDKIYFGGESPEELRKQGRWERFWIVPAETRRFGAPGNELTLFDVPLKVNTQSMKWHNRELVDDPGTSSSPGALAFTNWFTTNYDLIGRERFLTPPPESGITMPVPVFTELRRVALITAIAEKLRDQGVPMPFWMRNYEVQPVPFEKFTPGLEVKRSNQRIVARIYGGVNLSVPDSGVKQFTAEMDLSRLPKQEAATVREKLTLARSLEGAVRTGMATAKPLEVRAITSEGKLYQGVALPGAETMALAPNHMNEADLVVPVEGGDPIQLVRSYSSFFNPAGAWGKGWALDLPRLEQLRVPARRGDRSVEYKIAYELITPLNSIYARFSRVEVVPALNGSRLMVPDQPGEFFGIADDRPDFLSGPTLKLLRKDGMVWHFSKAGDLVATDQAGSRIIYERDEKGRLARIAGLRGRQALAFIELRYNGAGRVESAKARIGDYQDSIRYEYDGSGKLVGVVSDSGRLGYRYEGPLVTAVTHQAIGSDKKKAEENTLRRFQYGAGGQLLAETDADGAKTEYRVKADTNGSAMTVVYAGTNSQSDFVRYDRALRPVEAKYADGTRASWNYPEGGGLVVDMAGPDGGQIRLTEAADQRSRTVQLDQNRRISAKYDEAGRLTSMVDNGRELLRQQWSPDGRLRSTANGTSSAIFEYDPDGIVSRLLQVPPGEQGTFKRWQATKLDSTGRAREITDYRGLHVLMDYDDSGTLKALVIRRDGKNYGYQISRDKSGRIHEVKSSWGRQLYSYDAEGELEKLELEKANQSSVAVWKSGLLQKARLFDGGEYALAYYKEDKHDDLLQRIIVPNGLQLKYEYDKSNRLSRVVVGQTYQLSLAYDAKGRLSGWNYSALAR